MKITDALRVSGKTDCVFDVSAEYAPVKDNVHLRSFSEKNTILLNCLTSIIPLSKKATL